MFLRAGAAHERTLRGGTVLRLAYMAQSRRATVRRCLALKLVHVRRGRPHGVDRSGQRSGGSCTLARRGAFGGLRAPRSAGAQQLVADRSTRLINYLHLFFIHTATMHFDLREIRFELMNVRRR